VLLFCVVAVSRQVYPGLAAIWAPAIVQVAYFGGRLLSPLIETTLSL
jgi:hypothetical protein